MPDAASASLTEGLLDCLKLPEHAVRYAVSTLFKERFPDKAILESEDGDFDVSGFCKAGHCELQETGELSPSRLHVWHGRRRVRYQVQSGRLTWEGTQFDCYHYSAQNQHTAWESVAVVGERQEQVDAFFDAVCTWHSELRQEVWLFDGYWQKSRSLYRSIENASWDELVLADGMKHELLDDLQRFLDQRESYERFGVPWKRGVLLSGPPGNGKTHCIKGLAKVLRVQQGSDGELSPINCLYVRTLESCHGPHSMIGSIFEHARDCTPCMLVFEDLESIVTEKNRSVFLNELDGLASNDGILVVGSTNHPASLDPAIASRPSRFDRTWSFALPGPAERLQYISNWNDKLDSAMRVHVSRVEALAGATEDFSFAYLKELFVSSMLRWVQASGEPASAADVPARGTAPAATTPGTSADMHSILESQIGLLRAQMRALATATLEEQAPAAEYTSYDAEAEYGD